MFENMTGILGIGTDLLQQARIEMAVKRHGERFARRILTAKEYDTWLQHDIPNNYLAKAFAAKEALSKALGTGFSDGVSFQHFTISRSAMGKPQVDVSGRAKDIMIEKGATALLLSLSDEGDFIQAFSILAA